jgi:hypothetical protein
MKCTGASMRVPGRPGHELGARGHAELGEQVGQMRVDGALADGERMSDRLVRQALGHQADDLALAVGQRLR